MIGALGCSFDMCLNAALISDKFPTHDTFSVYKEEEWNILKVNHFFTRHFAQRNYQLFVRMKITIIIPFEQIWSFWVFWVPSLGLTIRRGESRENFLWENLSSTSKRFPFLPKCTSRRKPEILLLYLTSYIISSFEWPYCFVLSSQYFTHFFALTVSPATSAFYSWKFCRA